MTRSLGRQIAEYLGDVLALRTEGRRTWRPGRIVAEDVAVLFHRRAAPRGIDGDGVYIGGLECGNHLASEMSCIVFET